MGNETQQTSIDTKTFDENLRCSECDETIEGEPFMDNAFNPYCSDDCRYPYKPENDNEQ